MKKLILFLVAVLMIVAICACADNPTENAVVEDKPSMFVKVESGAT